MGIRVNVTAEFIEPKKLKLRGTIMGIISIKKQIISFYLPFNR